MITNRQSIAEALSAVEGVRGHAKRPTTLQTGDAWPLIDDLTRGPGAVFQTRWRICVLLGGDESSAADRLETLVPEITQALHAVAYVDSARPIALPTEAGEIPACEIIARSE
jgi:hypothetical protein